MRIKVGSLNIPCPYCQRECRYGVGHYCEAVPVAGCNEVLIRQCGGGIMILLSGTTQ